MTRAAVRRREGKNHVYRRLRAARPMPGGRSIEESGDRLPRLMTGRVALPSRQNPAYRLTSPNFDQSVHYGVDVFLEKLIMRAQFKAM